ncbi:MAG TPA: branched-chain amino acid ABC transporter permease [Symbiobacteriaceae bacterium]|nr:branched-chain amino acid ABC transporter permease [Symbiobacteriaceae bacterium]
MKRRTALTNGLLLAALAAVPWVIKGVGWRPGYLFQIVNLLPIWVLASLSLTVIAGFGGQVSVGQAGFMAIGAYGTGLLCTLAGWPWWAGVAAGTACAMVTALLIGIPTLRLRGPYFVMGSLAFGGIVYTIALNWIDLTGGPGGVRGVPAFALGSLDLGSDTALFYLLWGVAVLVMALLAGFQRTRLGKSLAAIREDELAANAVGIPVGLVKAVAFAVSGGLAGLSGALLAHFMQYISPDSFTVSQSLLFLTMVLIGGVDRISGAVVGSALLLAITELLRDLANVQLLVYGLIMLAVVLFMPAGVVGEVARLRQRKAAAVRAAGGAASQSPVASWEGN